MHTGLLHLHSLLRWVVLILLLISIAKAYQGKKLGEVYSDKKLNMFTVLGVHLQLVIGVILYIISPMIQRFFEEGEIMKETVKRYWIVEHMVGMLIAVVIITIGNAKAKRKETDLKKHKTIFTFFLIGLLIIVFTIPWPFREIGRNWFSFM